MLQTSPQSSEFVDAATGLVTFMAGLSEPLLPPREQREFVTMFAALSGLALATPERDFQRGKLCSDGTPIECSFALDDEGRHALRFVCDVSAAARITDGSPHPWFRDLAEKIVPRFEASREELDRLFAVHLANAPPSMRFQAWFGSGAAPGARRTTLIYFNTQWLTTPDLFAILAPYIPSQNLSVLGEWLEACDTQCVGTAYDFDSDGLCKIKLYVRLDAERVRKLETMLGHFPGNTGSKLLGLFTKAFDPSDFAQRGGAMLALGQPMRSASLDASAYFHLESWGVPDFVGLAPTLQRLLCTWGVDFDDGLSEGPSGCAPTLLSLSASGERERLGVYFKPLLPRQLVGTRKTPPEDEVQHSQERAASV